MYSDRDYYRPTGLGGFSFFPPVIKNLLIINIAVYLVNNLLLGNVLIEDVPANAIIDHYFALQPLGHGFFIWQLITYQFMHANFMHIFLNMFVLWMFGMEIENLWGSKKFLFYYLTCGVGGGLLQLLLSPIFSSAMPAATVGASGAIYGVMVAFGMMFPDRYIFLWFLVPVKAKYFIAFYVVIEFLSIGSMDLVARFAHIGGAIVGFIFILLDSRSQFSFKNFLGSFRKSSSRGSKNPYQFRRRPFSTGNDVEDAEFYEINKKEENTVSQEEIDKILDKISQSGYQNLTEREKKILFEASKRS